MAERRSLKPHVGGSIPLSANIGSIVQSAGHWSEVPGMTVRLSLEPPTLRSAPNGKASDC